jgi:hypothetical protein
MSDAISLMDVNEPVNTAKAVLTQSLKSYLVLNVNFLKADFGNFRVIVFL